MTRSSGQGLRRAQNFAQSTLRTAHLHNGKRGCRDGVREVTSRGRHGAHDGYSPLATRGTDAARTTGSLVEGGQTGTKVRRVSVDAQQPPRRGNQRGIWLVTPHRARAPMVPAIVSVRIPILPSEELIRSLMVSTCPAFDPGRSLTPSSTFSRYLSFVKQGRKRS